MNQLNGWIVSLIDDNESCNPNGMTDDNDRDMAPRGKVSQSEHRGIIRLSMSSLSLHVFAVSTPLRFASVVLPKWHEQQGTITIFITPISQHKNAGRH